MTTVTDDLRMEQRDGCRPTTLAAGSAPGESGVTVLSMRFDGGAHFSARLAQHHLVCFHMSPQLPLECRMAGRVHQHEPPTGSLAVCPAGIDCAADAEGSVDCIVVAIASGRIALAAAEDSSLEAQLIERFAGYDPSLLKLARALVSESANGYLNGPLFWNGLASHFIHGLLDRHTSAAVSRGRGMLGKNVLQRLKDYVMTHLDGPLDVDTLAGIAGRSPFHFTRVFTRSVGVTPHRYIVHLRLHRAVELIREERLSFTEIAARTGFADQSHLTRWIRRVHGVSLTQLTA